MGGIATHTEKLLFLQDSLVISSVSEKSTFSFSFAFDCVCQEIPHFASLVRNDGIPLSGRGFFSMGGDATHTEKTIIPPRFARHFER